MSIGEIMTRDVRFIAPEATLKDAAQMMDDFNIGALPVCANGRVEGIISDRDIVIRSISAGQDPNTVKVQDAMTAPATCIFEDQDVTEASVTMRKSNIRRIPVLNRDNRLVGLLSIDDIAAARVQGSEQVVQDISKFTKNTKSAA